MHHVLREQAAHLRALGAQSPQRLRQRQRPQHLALALGAQLCEELGRQHRGVATLAALEGPEVGARVAVVRAFPARGPAAALRKQLCRASFTSENRQPPIIVIL